MFLYYLERVCAELLHYLLCSFRADSLDRTRREITQNVALLRRKSFFVGLSFKLLSVGLVVDPFSRDCQLVPVGEIRYNARDGDRVARGVLHFKNHVAVVLVLVNYGVDYTRHSLLLFSSNIVVHAVPPRLNEIIIPQNRRKVK